jgi:hypothetical protein
LPARLPPDCTGQPLRLIAELTGDWVLADHFLERITLRFRVREQRCTRLKITLAHAGHCPVKWLSKTQHRLTHFVNSLNHRFPFELGFPDVQFGRDRFPFNRRSV